jgi:SAM-dependent methyltransferase
MRDGFYRQTGRVEGRHWWFRHRRRLVSALLDQAISEPLRSDARALDVGCGTGGNLETIERRGYFTVGIDRSSLALDLARKSRPEAVVISVDANRLGDCFAPHSFDLVTVFNVLYHEWISEEREVLEQVRRIVRPGGRLLLTEPAFESLRRRHDRVDFGARRYTRRRLAEMVTDAGFAVERATYFNVISLAPAAVVAALDRLRGTDDPEAGSEQTGELSVPPAPLNRMLLELCRVESFWLRRVGDLPFGVGVLVLARTTGESQRGVRRHQVGM